ncbi:carboxypeptidase regulatory-like domain-containing protein [Flavobacterium sp.]|jgi:hypothetical protein|uniref:carboxypeptidase regulatory-like domain-containing protein n=1 Tax=Flavobacterium sp. TaxID=239 RepID=UPI0037BFF58B
MKLLPFSWSFILILFITSCNSDDDSPAAATRANISGSVNLYNESTNLVDLSNMTVSVLGTMPLISAVTDAEGKFVLSNVPFGTYTLEYTKNGYGTYKKFGVVHGTNGQATALTATPSLGQVSTTNITGITASTSANQVVLSMSTNPGGSAANRRYIRYFLSTSQSVSATNYSYYSPVFTSQINPFEKTILATELVSAGFTSGQQVYVRAYGDSFWDNAYDSPEFNRRIFPNLNANTVPAAAFIVP